MIKQKCITRRCIGQFVSCAFVVLLRKSIPQRATYKLPLNLALGARNGRRHRSNYYRAVEEYGTRILEN
jgi:hypothetical protein